MDTEKLNELRQIIEDSDNIVFFGGAGVSTESGIPDFRSVDGLYNQKYKYPPETIISHSFYRRNPEEFYRFYKDKMIFADAKPNKAHIKLAELEKQGKLKAVITQNIDGLHINANYTTLQTVRDIAESCGVSESYVHRAVRRTESLTVKEYINKLRLRHAIHQVEQGGNSLSVISKSCGFQSVSYFYRVFKKYYGMTPTQYFSKKEPHY